LLRRIVRRNPWLLADDGQISRSQRLGLWLFDAEVSSAVSLLSEQKAKLLAERERPPTESPPAAG
jgi:hypothetical protein